jgi:hypothetical protein
MKVTESAVEKDTVHKLSSSSEEALKKINLPKAVSLIDSIDQAVFNWQVCGKPPKSTDLDKDDLIYALGTAWGNAIVDKHAWHWADLTFHEFDDWVGRAIVSEDGSLMILPYAHIHECLSGSDEVKIRMSLSVIVTDVIPNIQPNSYVNLIHNVQRIVPRL